MVRLAITGGVAEGKSTILHLLELRGACAIDSDELVQEFFIPGTDLWEQLVRMFGETILKEDKTIRRDRLSFLVFRDQVARRQMNRLVHPKVVAALQRRYEEFQRRVAALGTTPVFAVEVPLLIEVALQDWFDRVLVAHASPSIQRERLRARGVPNAIAEAILQAQLPTRAKLPFADWIVPTNRSIRALEKKIERIWTLLSNPLCV